MTLFVLTDKAWIIGGVFAFLSLLMTCHQIYKHLYYWTKPQFQKWIVRILLMVPIYALGSFLSLRFPEKSVYFDTLRNMYEAFVIYSFLSLCFEYLGGESNMVHNLQGHYHKPTLVTLTCCVKPFPYNIAFLRVCKKGTLQFCVVKPVTSLITIGLEAKGWYNEGDLNPKYGYLYIALIYNASIFVAMMSLVIFYQATREHLKPHKPILKFLIVKSVIFLAFWQGIGLAISESAGGLDTEGAKPGQVAAAYQNFFICIEMFFISILHLKAFSWKPFIGPRHTQFTSDQEMTEITADSGDEEGTSPSPENSTNSNKILGRVVSTLSPRDIVHDTIRNFSTKYTNYHQTKHEDEAEADAHDDDDEENGDMDNVEGETIDGDITTSSTDAFKDHDSDEEDARHETSPANDTKSTQPVPVTSSARTVKNQHQDIDTWPGQTQTPPQAQWAADFSEQSYASHAPFGRTSKGATDASSLEAADPSRASEHNSRVASASHSRTSSRGSNLLTANIMEPEDLPGSSSEA